MLLYFFLKICNSKREKKLISLPVIIAPLFEYFNLNSVNWYDNI